MFERIAKCDKKSAGNGGLNVDGTDNENISMKELCVFLEQVNDEKQVCPICKKYMLKLDDFQEHIPTFETYIRGIDYFITFDISCPCGFKNTFNSMWCRKGIDGQSEDVYRVGIKIGGVMEKPDYTYEHIEEIKAYSKKDAIEKYKKKHPRLANGYWSVSIVPDYY